MFTGIIEEIGLVKNIKRGSSSLRLELSGHRVMEGLMIGDSIAVNGVCLTVTDFHAPFFYADVMPETIKRSALSSLKTGSFVNLERAMPANGRFGGHMVSGHIDGTGKILRIRKDDNAIIYTILAEPKLLHYIIEKGSIAIDGISLTVMTVTHDSFTVSVIPHTADQTTLSKKKIGDPVNLENDMIGKYLEKFCKDTAEHSAIRKEFTLCSNLTQ